MLLQRWVENREHSFLRRPAGMMAQPAQTVSNTRRTSPHPDSAVRELAHRPLAFPQGVHRLYTLERQVTQTCQFLNAPFGPQDPLQPTVVTFQHITQGISPAGVPPEEDRSPPISARANRCGQETLRCRDVMLRGEIKVQGLATGGDCQIRGSTTYPRPG